MQGYGWAAILVVVALAAALAVGYFLRTDSSETSACRDRSPQPVAIAFGDSLVQGIGATTPGGFVSHLSVASGIPIRNLGRAGDTTETAVSRLPAVLDARPDIAIVLLGGNDALRRISPAVTEANLDEIISELKSAGAEVVLLGVMGNLFNDPYPAMFERLAEKHDAAYVPNVLEGLLGRQEYMSDAIHPNEAGYTHIASRVLPAFEEACDR